MRHAQAHQRGGAAARLGEIVQSPVIGGWLLVVEQMAEKFKIGLALGSGGVRGMAHFGVIRTLIKHGIKISCVAGSSSGSVIGADHAVPTA